MKYHIYKISIIVSCDQFDEILSLILQSDIYIAKDKWYFERDCILEDHSLIRTTFHSGSAANIQHICYDVMHTEDLTHGQLQTIVINDFESDLKHHNILSAQYKFIGEFVHGPWSILLSRIFEGTTTMDVDRQLYMNNNPSYCRLEWIAESDFDSDDLEKLKDELIDYFNQSIYFFKFD